MISDYERHDVAERLRGYVSEWRDMPNFSVQKGVACSLGIVRFDVESQLLRLADLIYSSDMSQGRRDIVACDRDALLELADEMEHVAGMGALLTAGGLEKASASIREALGVES